MPYELEYNSTFIRCILYQVYVLFKRYINEKHFNKRLLRNYFQRSFQLIKNAENEKELNFLTGKNFEGKVNSKNWNFLISKNWFNFEKSTNGITLHLLLNTYLSHEVFAYLWYWRSYSDFWVKQNFQKNRKFQIWISQ